MGLLVIMVFLGSVKLDAAKRLTLIKEVAEILDVEEKDHVMFYLEDGEIIIRKVLPMMGRGIKGAEEEINEWARKRRIEINMIANPDEREIAEREMQDVLAEKYERNSEMFE